MLIENKEIAVKQFEKLVEEMTKFVSVVRKTETLQREDLFIPTNIILIEELHFNVYSCSQHKKYT